MAVISGPTFLGTSTEDVEDTRELTLTAQPVAPCDVCVGGSPCLVK